MAVLKLEDILELARSADLDDRETAARELQKYPFDEAVRSTLLDLMGDSDWRVRHAAVDALITGRRTEVIPEILYALYEEANAGKRNAAIVALHCYGREILPYLEPHLLSKNADVRMFLASVLGDLRDAHHIGFLNDCLRDPEQNLVSAAILALGKIGHPSSVPHLVEMLHHQNLWYQFQAIEASGEMQDEALLPHLVPLLESSYCRRAVLSALGKFHHPIAYQALLGSLIHEEQLDRQVLSALIEILQAPQPEILRRKDQTMVMKMCEEVLTESQRAAFVTEIEKLGLADETSAAHRSGGTPAVHRPPVHTPSVRSLLQTIKDEDAVVRRRSLQQMGNEVHIEFREPLMAALADEDARAREYAAAALAAYSSPEVTDALLSSLPDEDVWVRVAIYKSLPVDDQRIGEMFKQQLQQDNPIGQAAILRCLKHAKEPETAELLLSYLNHPDPEIRAAACESLSSFDSDSVRKRLLIFLENDSSWNVRVAAIRSLNQLEIEGYQAKLMDRLLKDEDASVRREILNRLQNMEELNFPDTVFDFLRDPALTDSACQFLLSHSSHKKQILERAESCAPAIRRIVERLFEGIEVSAEILPPYEGRS
jgi:HEAT repeat protein